MICFQFHCCGVKDWQDWPSHNNMTTQASLPLSCCTLPSGLGPYSCAKSNTTEPYAAGCKEKFGDFIRDEAVVIGGAGITIALIQVRFCAKWYRSVAFLGIGFDKKVLGQGWDVRVDFPLCFSGILFLLYFFILRPGLYLAHNLSTFGIFSRISCIFPISNLFQRYY